MNGLAFSSLCGINSEEDNASLLDNLHSLLMGPVASPCDPSTNHIKETPYIVHASSHFALQVQEVVGAAVCAGDMKMFCIAYVGGFRFVLSHEISMMSEIEQLQISY